MPKASQHSWRTTMLLSSATSAHAKISDDQHCNTPRCNVKFRNNSSSVLELLYSIVIIRNNIGNCPGFSGLRFRAEG